LGIRAAFCCGVRAGAREEFVSHIVSPFDHDVPPLAPAQRELLIRKAKEARAQAYAPYSRFKVGAAVLAESGRIYTGCNIENSSYGLTNCAERTAIFTAVAAEGPGMRLKAVAVWVDPEGQCSPCGACRQVILEFGPDALVLYQGREGVVEIRASLLLPAGFRL
jgi:cytidine deaminase